MPADILIYAVIAAVMVFWLKNVIGTRHGEERERPNPFDETSAPSEPVMDIAKDIKPTMKASGNDAVDAGLVQIALADKSFDLNQFKENASDAFTMIVLAFAEGDKDTLRDLCSDDVYNAFAMIFQKVHKVKIAKTKKCFLFLRSKILLGSHLIFLAHH